jgi:hypothetical protein
MFFPLTAAQVTLSVPNIALAERWYETVLGFERVSFANVSSIRGILLLMQIPNTTVQVNPKKTHFSLSLSLSERPCQELILSLSLSLIADRND